MAAVATVATVFAAAAVIVVVVVVARAEAEDGAARQWQPRALTFIVGISDRWTGTACEQWTGATLSFNHQVGEWGGRVARVSDRS